MDAWREKHVRRARTYSARHHCQVRVEHVVKGRGKGRYETVVEGNNACWWPSSVVEVIAVYYDGQEIQNHGKVVRVIPSRSNPMVQYTLRQREDGTLTCTCPTWKFSVARSPVKKSCHHCREYEERYEEPR